jgi:hypothetical protein
MPYQPISRKIGASYSNLSLQSKGSAIYLPWTTFEFKQAYCQWLSTINSQGGKKANQCIIISDTGRQSSNGKFTFIIFSNILHMLQKGPEILNQIHKYRRHCLRRGGVVNAKKPPLAWKMVTKPKSKGGLGVINLRLQNEALLLKNLHIFLTKRIRHGLICHGLSTMPMVKCLDRLKEVLSDGNPFSNC